MRQNSLRARLRIKREIVQALQYIPGNSISLRQRQRQNDVEYEIIGTYSNSNSLEVLDPRTGQIEGHFFQDRKVFQIKNVILEPKQGVVYASSGELVEESMNWPVHQFYSSFPWNPGNNIPKTFIEKGICLPSSAYGHWIMEDLPLFIFSLEQQRDAVILVSKNPPRFVSEFLKTIDREIVYLDGPVIVESLILVEKHRDAGWPHPKDIEILESYFPFSSKKQVSAPRRKVYASRGGSKRSPTNEFQVEKLFENSGFDVFRLEELDFVDEIQLMSEVSHIAGFHGSGLANIIWMPKGGNLLDMLNSSYWTSSAHRLADLKQARYDFLVYKGAFNAEIPLSQVAEKLEKFLA